MARRTKAGGARRKARMPKPARLYRIPALRVSVVHERWVRTRQRPILRDSLALAKVLRACIPEDDDREHVVMAILDVRQRLLAVHTVALGSNKGSVIHPRELLRIAVLMGASSIGLAHNHCSGETKPSREDIALTRRLVACVELMGMRFADHVIFGRDGRWLSMRQRGHLQTEKPVGEAAPRRR